VAKETVGDGTSRGEFLARSAGVAGMAIGAGVWATGVAGLTAEAAEAAAAATAPGPGGFALELDGILIGLLKSARGGHAYADVVEEKLGVDHIAKKHLANLKYEDITIQIGFSMTKAIYDWIAASWASSYQRKNGSIQAANYKMEIKQVREFFHALITETTIPACDASAKDPAYLTLKLAPEQTVSKAGSGKLKGTLNKNQKKWVPSNFRLEIDGLPCKKVTKIDSFTVKQTFGDSLGDTREDEPGKLEIPNLRITFAESDVGPWAAWFDDFVIKGNSTDESEKGGRLTFLAPDRKKELATIEFFNLGIFKLSSDKPEANADKTKRVTAELYVERMAFKYGSNVIG
jgi:hypothetical protein